MGRSTFKPLQHHSLRPPSWLGEVALVEGLQATPLQAILARYFGPDFFVEAILDY